MPAMESSGDKASAVKAQHSCNTLCARHERLQMILEGRVSCTSWCSGFSKAVASKIANSAVALSLLRLKKQDPVLGDKARLQFIRWKTQFVLLEYCFRYITN